MERYKCYLCNAEVDLPKKRIKCLVCSKMSLVPIAVLQQSGSVSSDNKKEPVEKIFKENKFIDDLTQCLDDLDFNKKVKFSVSQREDRKREDITKRCLICQKDFTTKFGNENRCTKCSRG
jgi:DNA-directed RNA polymerase subunit RPC12/RpoP